MSNKIDPDGSNPSIPPDIPPGGTKEPGAKQDKIVSNSDGEFLVLPDGTMIKIMEKPGTVVGVIHTRDADYEVIATGGPFFSVVKIRDNSPPKDGKDSEGPGSDPTPPGPVSGSPSTS